VVTGIRRRKATDYQRLPKTIQGALKGEGQRVLYVHT